MDRSSSTLRKACFPQGICIWVLEKRYIVGNAQLLEFYIFPALISNLLQA